MQRNTAVSEPTSGSNKHQHCSKRMWHLQKLQLALLGVPDVAPLSVLVENRPAPLLDQLLGHPPVGCGFVWQLEKEEHHLEADRIQECGLQELFKAPELLTKREMHLVCTYPARHTLPTSNHSQDPKLPE